MIAYGAALSLEELFENFNQEHSVLELIEILEQELAEKKSDNSPLSSPYFESEEEKKLFFERHAKKRPKIYTFAPENFSFMFY